jgi:hypothetical protein
MPFILYVLGSLVVGLIMPATRPYVLGFLGLLIFYLLFDNFVTEGSFPLDDIEVTAQKVSSYTPGDSPNQAYAVELTVINRGNVSLESIQANLTLWDCPNGSLDASCAPLARRPVYFQVFAEPRMAREMDSMVLFDGVVRPTGSIIPSLTIEHATSDWL